MLSEEVTIHDVARTARVSPSTVSNVLNGRTERMRPETSERVRRAIKQLGYAPNQAARQLKTGFVPMLGLIVPSVANPFWGAFARSVEKAALAEGYQVLLCNGERDPKREQQYAESLWGRGIRGVMFGSSPVSFDHFLELSERGLQVVAFDRQAQNTDQVGFDSISVDNELGVRLAVNYLLALGHRRIGFLSGPIRTVNRLKRLDGFRSALADADVPFDEQLVWEGALSSSFGDIEGTDIGRTAARDLLSRPKRPTALFAINDMYAFGAYAGARDLGLRIPQDVSIIGFDDIVLAEIVDPPLTTIRQPLDSMMQSAVRLLIGRLEETRTGPPEHMTATPELIVRGSTTQVSVKDEQ